MAVLKCPNPACSFTFDPTRVPPGTVLACQRCGMRFTLGPAPVAPPSQHAAPSAPSVTAPEVSEAFQAFTAEDPTTGTHRPIRKSSGGLGGSIVAVGGIMLVLMVGLTLLFVTMRFKRGFAPGGGGSANELRHGELNFAFAKPPETWKQDQETMNRLNVNVFTYKRSEPDAWVALSVRDYDTRMPRPSEMKDRMADQLKRVFEIQPADMTLEPTEWAGQKAERCQFRAVSLANGEPCVGECLLLAYQGIGYWFYSWSAEKDAAAVAEELVAVRDGFRLLDQRNSWRPSTVTEVVHRSKTGLYQFTDFERIWAEPGKGRTPTDEDPKADRLMQGKLKARDRRDFVPTADVVFLILGNDDKARAYVENRYKTVPDTKIEEIAGPPEGDPPVGPEAKGTPTTRLKVTRGDDSLRSADKLVVFATIESGGQLIVAEASCPWRERSVWERRLIQLVGSLQPGK